MNTTTRAAQLDPQNIAAQATAAREIERSRVKVDTIHEKPKDTAKRIRKALKAHFSGVKFSVKTETYSMGSSVNVSYTDGPALDSVKAIVDHFASYKGDVDHDQEKERGYYFKGKHYQGAKFVKTKRERSPDRKEIIKAALDHQHEGKDKPNGGYYFVWQWNDMERDLIEAGLL